MKVLKIVVLLIGISFYTPTLAHSNPFTDILTRDDIDVLVDEVKEELESKSYEPRLMFDESTGMLEEVMRFKIIKIYDSNDKLLLEAPVNKLRGTRNESLRRLLNASEFLIHFSNTTYYKLDI